MNRLGFCVIVVAIMMIMACKEAPKEIVTEDLPTEENLVERGEYLVHATGCADCHAPKIMTPEGPVPDMDRFLMGYPGSDPLPPIPEGLEGSPWILFTPDLTAAVGPWGISYAGNLTPHETGIGNWSLEQFVRAIREGKYKGLENSRPLMPPMPWPNYKLFTDQDLEAIFLYLKSIDPIDNVVPAYQPPAE